MNTGDRFCGECGTPAVAPAVAANTKTLICGNCGQRVESNEQFCGTCGFPVSRSDAKPELFPLFGVSLGQTSAAELARLGIRANSIDKSTGEPYQYYEVRRTNFWYDGSNVANRIYLARGIHPMPEPWRKLGLNWAHSFDEWLALLERLGFEVCVDGQPDTVQYRGHDSFFALVRANQPPIRMMLDFNYNDGRSTESKETLYALTVTIAERR